MKRVKIIAAIVITLSFILVAGMLYRYARRDSTHQKSEHYLLAEHIYDSVYNIINEPITISRTMANDAFLCEKLRNETSVSAEQIEADMVEYLSRIKENLGFVSAFVVSEKTHRYYTPRGVTKVLNPQSSPYDIWYQLFMESGKYFDLDTDRDQSNEYRWTIFVNIRIIDTDGTLLGVCGVGVFMDKVQELFATIEDDYKVKVNLVDLDGLVQADTDSTNIENEYIIDAVKDKAGSDSFTYASWGLNGFRMTRYMEALEWNLVIQGKNESTGLFATSIIVMAAICIILLLVLFGTTKSNGGSGQVSVLTDPTVDALTGLPNRNYLREAYGELGIFNTTRYKSIVYFDIDKFKILNDSVDGDDVLRELVVLIKKHLGSGDLLLRWGGDGFAVLMEASAEIASYKFEELCGTIKDDLDVTISVGVSQINLFDSIKTNFYRSVQLCYAVKEAGGNGVKKS